MATSSGNVGNGPYHPMYKLKPFQCIDVIEVPNVMYKVNSYYSDSGRNQGRATNSCPLASLERRQTDALKRLEELQTAVSALARQYNVTASSSSSSTSTGGAVARVSGNSQRSQNLGPGVHDIVISLDPSGGVPLSLVVLCEQLSARYTVLRSTFIHSSVSDTVPDRLKNLLSSNNGLKRSDCHIALTLVWKKVVNGPHLMVDPTRQTAVQGEANVARYLATLVDPAWDQGDIIASSQIDELLDVAQLQLVEGNSKEKAAGIRTLNSTLGKRDWLVGVQPTIADIVCWSILHQTGQAANPPANVKRWLGLCSQHPTFQTAAQLLS